MQLFPTPARTTDLAYTCHIKRTGDVPNKTFAASNRKSLCQIRHLPLQGAVPYTTPVTSNRHGLCKLVASNRHVLSNFQTTIYSNFYTIQNNCWQQLRRSGLKKLGGKRCDVALTTSSSHSCDAVIRVCALAAVLHPQLNWGGVSPRSSSFSTSNNITRRQ